ncbi:MAG: pre-peptidase C-terminal domain-containing protein [Alphaproteobacteria bacterium]|nr:pre-peptidase C-terminal domain-containing protein [Alphaproteobacteria bacterium]
MRLLLTALLALATTAQADRSQAEECLRNRIWEGYEQGWAVRTATSAKLGEGERRVYVVTLQADAQYRLLACADAGATDVDLVVHDVDGNVVAQDEDEGRQPTLDFKPKSTGTYYVAVYASAVAQPGVGADVGMAVTYK